MKRKFQLLAAASMLLITGAALFAQDPDSDKKPIANFGITPPEGGVVKGWAPAVIRTGAATKLDNNGPFGAKALKFDGSDAAVSTMDYGTMQERFNNAETLTISLAIRLDSSATGVVKPGFGFEIENGLLSFTNGSTFKITATEKLVPNRWYQVAVTCTRTEVKLYLDGVINNFSSIKTSGKVVPWFNPEGKFGKFQGSMASIQIWDRAVTDNEIRRIPTDSKGLDILVNDIESTKKDVRSEAVIAYLDATIEQISKIKNTRKTTVHDQQYAASIGMTALKLARADAIFRNTSLAKTPFTILQVQTASSQMRSPEKFPEDPQYTGCVRVAAAIGEYEPASFLVYGYKTLPLFSISISDFENEKGDVLPGTIVDQKLVAYVPRNGWNAIYYSNVTQKVPDLLVNSEDTVRYNFADDLILPAGSKMPQADAATIQPVTVVPNTAKHYWFTIKVPQDAKSGLYEATATVKSAGSVIGKFPIQLRVYPFTLPAAKTNYDQSRDYLAIVVGETTNLKTVGAKRHKADLQNALAHNINCPVIQAAGANDLEKDLAIRKELGMDLKNSIIALYPDNGTLMTAPDKVYSLPVGTDPYANAVSALATFKAAAGHTDLFFYGANASLLGSDEAAAKVWFDIVKKGAKVVTTGNSEAAYTLPVMDLLHARAYNPSYLEAEKWHNMRGRLISSGKQLVVFNPDIMRRYFGVTLYRENYDGFFLASFAGNPDVWTRNRTGIYHRQNLSYPTASGVPINTIAYEALREGIDDIRYITLLRMLVDEAFKSGNYDAIYAAKKAVSVFEQLSTGRMNLDLMRMEVADRIIHIMTLLGKDVK